MVVWGWFIGWFMSNPPPVQPCGGLVRPGMCTGGSSCCGDQCEGICAWDLREFFSDLRSPGKVTTASWVNTYELHPVPKQQLWVAQQANVWTNSLLQPRLALDTHDHW